MANSNKSKEFRIGRRENAHQTRSEQSNLEKAKKSFQGKKNVSRDYVTLKKRRFQDLKNPINPLSTAIHLVKAMTAEA